MAFPFDQLPKFLLVDASSSVPQHSKDSHILLQKVSEYRSEVRATCPGVLHFAQFQNISSSFLRFLDMKIFPAHWSLTTLYSEFFLSGPTTFPVLLCRSLCLDTVSPYLAPQHINSGFLDARCLHLCLLIVSQLIFLLTYYASGPGTDV